MVVLEGFKWFLKETIFEKSIVASGMYETSCPAVHLEATRRIKAMEAARAAAEAELLGEHTVDVGRGRPRAKTQQKAPRTPPPP